MDQLLEDQAYLHLAQGFWMKIGLGKCHSSSVKQVGVLKLFYFVVKSEAIEHVTYRWIG